MDERDELTVVASAANEAEANVIVGFLESQGIRATYDTRGELGSPFAAADIEPHQVFVRAGDAAQARALIADAEANA
jgi:hypothetical protein